MNLRPTLITLLAIGLFLPAAVCVLLGVGALLAAMQDEVGRIAVQRTVQGVLALWAIDLVLLVFALAFVHLGPPGE